MGYKSDIEIAQSASMLHIRDIAKKIAIDYGCDRIELNCWMFNENALAMYEHIGYSRQRIIYEMKL